MEITLTPELEDIIQRRIASGRFSSVLEVVTVALQAQEVAELGSSEDRFGFNTELRRRLDALDRGEFVSADEAKRRVEAAIVSAERLRA